MEVHLSLPWPPSVNHYYIHARRGKRVCVIIGQRGLDYRDDVRRIFNGRTFARHPIAVEIVAHPPDRRKRDLDNLFKCTLDAMQKAGLYNDDNQIQELKIVRGDVVKDGRLDVTVKTMEM